jgi:ring-1,2-phenylacetyl-CoA epoxidase subunit PaaE
MNTILLKITRIVNETPGSKTFYLKPEGQEVSYKAGQFLTLLLSIEGKEVRRAYSLGSTYQIDEEMFITFKRIENGAVSRYLFDRLNEGDVLEALPPAGRFTID